MRSEIRTDRIGRTLRPACAKLKRRFGEGRQAPDEVLFTKSSCRACRGMAARYGSRMTGCCSSDGQIPVRNTILPRGCASFPPGMSCACPAPCLGRSSPHRAHRIWPRGGIGQRCLAWANVYRMFEPIPFPAGSVAQRIEPRSYRRVRIDGLRRAFREPIFRVSRPERRSAAAQRSTMSARSWAWRSEIPSAAPVYRRIRPSRLSRRLQRPSRALHGVLHPTR